MEQQYEKKIFRLMFILNRLTSREMVTPSILASEFNVTVRTVQRDLEMLSMTGFPLFSENGSYKFVDGFSLRKISVNPDEKFLLLLFYKLFSKIGQPFDAAAKNLLDKMLLSSDTEDQSFDKEATEIIKKEFGKFSEQLAVKLVHYRGGVPRLVKGAVKQPSVWIDTDKGKQHRGSTGTTLGANIPTPEVDAAWGDDAWLQEDETDNGGAW